MEHGDGKSVVPQLQKVAWENPDYLARMHALWTLEGLGAATPDLIRAALKDEHPQVRRAAIRVSESLFKAGDDSLEDDIRAMISQPHEDVVIQAMLTAKHLGWPDAGEQPDAGAIRVADRESPMRQRSVSVDQDPFAAIPAPRVRVVRARYPACDLSSR